MIEHVSDTIEKMGDREAVVDVLNFLPDTELTSFFRWKDRDEIRFENYLQIDGHPVQIGRYENWKLEEEFLWRTADRMRRSGLEQLLNARKNGARQDIVLQGYDLVLFHERTPGTSCGQIVILPPQAIAAFLNAAFPNAKLTPILQRLMTCYLGGLSLTAAATQDGKSPETLKSQTRELKLRLGVARTEDIGRIIGTRIGLGLRTIADNDIGRRNLEFERYVERYLPKSVRAITLLDKQSRVVRILDMGPKSGKPVVCLHPIILPNIRAEDIELLNATNLRLIWPLRNGLLGPTDPKLSDVEHLIHACEGVNIAKNMFCDGKIAILAFNASSTIAIAYARRFADAVEALFFAGVSVDVAPRATNARRLLNGMIALTTNNRQLMHSAYKYFCHFILTPDRMAVFLAHHFRDRPADREVIDEELQGAFGSDRLCDALVNSFLSIQQEFGFQKDNDWATVGKVAANMHFMHGSADVLTPLEYARQAAETVPHSSFHVLDGAGDLLYHTHLRSVLAPVWARLTQ